MVHIGWSTVADAVRGTGLGVARVAQRRVVDRVDVVPPVTGEARVEQDGGQGRVGDVRGGQRPVAGAVSHIGLAGLVEVPTPDLSAGMKLSVAPGPPGAVV